MARTHQYFRRFINGISRNSHLIGCAVSTSIIIHNVSRPVSCEAFKPSVRYNVTSYNNVEAYGLEKSQTLLESISKKIEDFSFHIARAFRYFERIFEYLLYGLPVTILAPTAYYMKDISPEIEEYLWKYIIWTIEQLGPTFIKFAQWASTRPDLYPPALIDKLLRLQDNVSVRHSMHTVEHTLADAFGKNWKSYIDLNPDPIGAGCIAQVFKGILKKKAENGKMTEIPVAIKLLHPHVEKLIRTDMELLTHIADFMDTFPTLELLSFGDTCRQFAMMMKDQLDLTIEAHNLIKFKEKFKHEKWASFPVPIDGFIHKNVLVETLMEGIPLSEYTKLGDNVAEPMEKLKKKLSDLGCRSVLKMIFFDNFVHGDLHPGNILVKFDEKGEPHYVFLDCGIVFSSKTEDDHRLLVDICLAFMKHDGILAGKLMVDRNPDRYKHLSVEQQQRNTDLFCKGLQKMIEDSEKEIFFEHFYKYVNQICDLARTYTIKLDPTYFQVAMALKIVEGVSLSLNKDIDMISRCVPVVVKAQALRKLGIIKFPTDEDDDIHLNTTTTNNKNKK